MIIGTCFEGNAMTAHVLANRFSLDWRWSYWEVVLLLFLLCSLGIPVNNPNDNMTLVVALWLHQHLSSRQKWTLLYLFERMSTGG